MDLSGRCFDAFTKMNVQDWKSYFNDLITLKTPTNQKHGFANLTPYEQWKLTNGNVSTPPPKPIATSSIDPNSTIVDIPVVKKRPSPILPRLAKKSNLIVKVNKYMENEQEPLLETTPLLNDDDGDYTSPILDELDDIHSISNNSITKLVSRGNDINNLKQKAKQLKNTGKLFKKKMTKVKNDTFMMIMKQNSLLGMLGFWFFFCVGFIIFLLLLWVFQLIFGWSKRRTPYFPPSTVPTPGVPGGPPIRPPGTVRHY